MFRTLDEVIDRAFDSRLSGVWTALPGRVKAFNAASSTCTVQPFPSMFLAGEAVVIPEIADVPVTYPSGGGSSITWPLAAGDVVLLLFSTLPLARYREDGADGNPVETRRQDLSDAWAIPLAGGAQPVATPERLIIQQPDALLGAGKILIGTAAATLPTVPIPLVPGPIVPAGFMQPHGRGARTGDTIKLVIDPATVATLISAMASIAAGNVPASIELLGVIASGSSIVEVA